MIASAPHTGCSARPEVLPMRSALLPLAGTPLVACSSRLFMLFVDADAHPLATPASAALVAA